MNRDVQPITLDEALDYLREALPLADRVSLSEDALRRVAEHALAVRAETPWGLSVPRDVFLPFVLFPRVNNENPEFYHAEILGRLRDRLRGLDMAGAAQAINRWCFEQATYQSTDGRTASALTVMRRGFGRCGEESVLLTCALRACGIPARQVYVPLWSHCDDNHAWVEAWVDGVWRYMGACEPELALDSGWFTAAASKAMLVHTRAYGVLPAGERAENHIGSAWVLNRTAAYARTRLLTVRVMEDGGPKAGVRVDFEVANMAAYHPICTKITGADGKADLLTGLGVLHIWVTDGARSMGRAVDVAEQDLLELDFGGAAEFVPGSSEYAQRPPRESKIQPADFPAEQVEAHERWLAETDAARQVRFAMPEGSDPLLQKARGNRGVIEAFLADARWADEDKRALLGSLREKDLVDVTGDVLADALEGALPFKADYPREIWAEGVLCPRVKNEMLAPVRNWLRDNLPACADGAAVWAHLARLEACEMDPVTLTPDLRAVMAYGKCSEAVRNVLFVACCRAKGIAARLDPVTGEKALWSEGEWRALLPARTPDARLILKNGAGRTLTAGVHFSVSVLEKGVYRPLALHGREVTDEMELPVFPGRYRVMTASRQIDGSLEGRIKRLEIGAGETREVALTLPEDRTAQKLLRAKLPPLSVGDGAVYPDALARQAGIVAVIAPGQEPTEHFLNELLEAKEALAARRIAVRLILPSAAQAENPKLKLALETLPDARCHLSPDAGALRCWREIMNAGELRLPLAVAVGRRGEGLFAFVNYNVGSVMTLIRIIDCQ